jgi:hypothetical protein
VDAARTKPSSGVTLVDLGFYQALDVDDAGRVIVWEGVCCVAPTGSLLHDPAVQQSIDLGDLGGGATAAIRMNQNLEVAGNSSTGNSDHPVVWESGLLHALPESAGSSGGDAADIADPLVPGGDRWVVGSVAGVGGLPAVWAVSGSGPGFASSAPILLPVPAGGHGYATGVNRDGYVVGWHAIGGAQPLPASWTMDGGSWERVDLIVPAGQAFAQALDVNAAGVAVGISGGASGCNRGLVWSTPSSSPVTLPDLDSGTCAWANAINDAGFITGLARGARGRQQAVLWVSQADGYVARPLGQLKGTTSSFGSGVNEPRTDLQGTRMVEVVGYSQGGGGNTRATLWRVTVP